MDAQGTLEVIAEISIAFTGFAGIVGALAPGRLKAEHRQIWLPFWAMIEWGLGTLFAALFPMLPHHLGASDPLVWSLSSVFVVLLLVRHGIFSSPQFLRAARDPSHLHLPGIEVSLRVVFALTLVTQVLNAVGVGLSHSVGGFLVGLYGLIVISALNFAYLMYALLLPEGGSSRA